MALEKYTPGLYYKAIYFVKMGYTPEEISNFLQIPKNVINEWIEGKSPEDARKIPLNVIKKELNPIENPC